jgi:hypothetical protein
MIRLISPDGRSERLRWTDKHPMSSFGLGVVLSAKSGVMLDGAHFGILALEGWRIECDTDLERRRVAGALAWSAFSPTSDAFLINKRRKS